MADSTTSHKTPSHFAFSRINLIAFAVMFALILAGFALMGGAASGDVYDPSIYGFRRIVLGPMVSLLGFTGMIAAILYTPRR